MRLSDTPFKQLCGKKSIFEVWIPRRANEMKLLGVHLHVNVFLESRCCLQGISPVNKPLVQFKFAKFLYRGTLPSPISQLGHLSPALSLHVLFIMQEQDVSYVPR